MTKHLSPNPIYPYINEYVPTGKRTLLQSFTTMSKNGNSMEAPKNRSKSAGVANMPIKFEITALHNAEATFPPAVPVKITHILTVVGRQVRMSKPSKRAFGKRLGKNVSIPLTRGRPTRKGHAKKLTIWTSALSLILATASFNSESSSDSPDRRNMHVTPNWPMKSSGRKIPPFFPNFLHSKSQR